VGAINHLEALCKTTPCLLLKKIFCLWCFVLLLALPKEACAIIEGDVELLKKIADGYETTMENLRTWHGEAIITTTIIIGDEGSQSELNKKKEFYPL